MKQVLQFTVAGMMLFSASLALPSQAQEQVPGTDSSKYQLERKGDGFVRLNRETGKTSYCRFVSDDLVCNLAIEERDALYREITDLQDQMAALQKEFDQVIGTAEEKLQRPEKEVPNPEVKDGLGADRDEIEQEIDKAVDITKRTMRKLFRAVKDLQKEFESE